MGVIIFVNKEKKDGFHRRRRMQRWKGEWPLDSYYRYLLTNSNHSCCTRCWKEWSRNHSLPQMDSYLHFIVTNLWYWLDHVSPHCLQDEITFGCMNTLSRY